MKYRNPQTRFKLNIGASEKVLEVGGGHNPHPRSNMVVDKFADSNYHRSADIKVLRNQQFMEADGENLPFKDKEFDYVICCHVLEHVENPHRFLQEQFRVAKRGYIETPSFIGEYLCPKESHKWILLEKDHKLYLVDKEKLGFRNNIDMGELFQHYFPKNSLAFKIFERTHPNMMTIRIEWDGSFEYVIDPSEEEILKYFGKTWPYEWGDAFFEKRSRWADLMACVGAFFDIIKTVYFKKRA